MDTLILRIEDIVDAIWAKNQPISQILGAKEKIF